MKDKNESCLDDFIKSMPAIRNHMELMAAIAQQPWRKDKINDFFDNEIISVPLAYATAFVAQDEGIRDVLHNRPSILERSSCHYCPNLDEFVTWLTSL